MKRYVSLVMGLRHIIGLEEMDTVISVCGQTFRQADKDNRMSDKVCKRCLEWVV